MIRAARSLHLSAALVALAIVAPTLALAEYAATAQAAPVDTEAFVPANGFNLGATVTMPAASAARFPAVVLAAGPGLQDRDYAIAGVAIFRQLAQALGRAGYLVVRYDGRNVGASGGRADTAGVSEYAEDAVAVVNWLRRRRDVDTNHVAIVGYAETAAIALTAASHDDHIKAVVLLAAAGTQGRDLVLEQQRHLLARSRLPDAERAARIDLQQQIVDAAITGVAAATLPPEARAVARSAWFKSWLLFDPAKVMPEVDQPILLVTGALDTEMPPVQTARIEALARSRHDSAAGRTHAVIVPDVNHLLVAAATGERDEYASLAGRELSPALGDAVSSWLKDALGVH